ncbi:unnamed protein product [Pleuronectes platessa]|uniref:Uncharacterized protein n=1 Tax=Pleuronectes platessa TaxID=8262 RepID=A0A9N7YHS2_PLEPL|nr:unnamed protein product [Pleuronectes platessa]
MWRVHTHEAGTSERQKHLSLIPSIFPRCKAETQKETQSCQVVSSPPPVQQEISSKGLEGTAEKQGNDDSADLSRDTGSRQQNQQSSPLSQESLTRRARVREPKKNPTKLPNGRGSCVHSS